MAIARVTHDFGFGVNSPTTGGVDTSAANFIICAVEWFNGSSFTFQDSKGNTWNPLAVGSAGETDAQMFWAGGPGLVVGSGHTFTASGVNVFGTVTMIAYSGVDSSPFDVQNHAIGNASTIQAGSVTPSMDGSLIVGTCGFSANPGSAFAVDLLNITDQQLYSAGVNEQGVIADLIQSTAAPINPTWSWTNGGACMACIAVFKPGASGAPEVPLMGQVWM